MKSYAVQITEEALSDMEALYSYIAVRLKAPENAMKQYNRIADAIMVHLIRIIGGKRDIFLKRLLLRFLLLFQ